MIYLLDTNIVSELNKQKPHGAVLAWYKTLQPSAFSISAITLYELQKGVEMQKGRNRLIAEGRERWVTEIQQSSLILPVGGFEARLAAHLMRNEPRALLEDALIAATAMVNGLTVATRNISHFERFGAILINPFEYRANLA